ncbi:MAG: MYXO-CTERM sorting domain-containing protein, partial [Myxococcota bacterium]
GEVCIGGKCKRNLCPGVKCSSGQFCRPIDNQCRQSCAQQSCREGQRCQDGACVKVQACSGDQCASVKDACVGVECPEGQRCQEGECIDPAGPNTSGNQESSGADGANNNGDAGTSMDNGPDGGECDGGCCGCSLQNTTSSLPVLFFLVLLLFWRRSRTIYG